MEQVRNVDHSVNDPLNQGQTFLVSSRTFRAFVPRPHGHPEICPERSTADRNHLVDQVKINHGVNNLFMTPDSVTAHGDTCPDLVLEDLWILRYQGSTAIENRLELSTDLPLIAGTPCYQGQISAQLKAILDRCRALVAQDPKVFQNKVGAGIAVGGDRVGGHEQVIHSMIDFYLINQMVPVGGGSFGANLGVTVWSRDKGAEGARADEEGLALIQRVVDRMVDDPLNQGQT